MAKIKIIGLDIDGTLTDGSIYIGEQGEALKVFCVKDGYGIKAAMAAGIPVFFITGRKAYPPTIKRLHDLGIDLKFLKDGVKDKVACAATILQEYNLQFSQMAFMGDDLPDLPLLKKVGLSAAPNDAVNEVKNHVHFITSLNGGQGAVRELIDKILKEN